MPDPLAPCEKHELGNCAECNGTAKAYDDSLSRGWDFVDGVPFEHSSDDPLPLIYGATVIRSNFGGHCVGCGRRYDQGAVIFQMRSSNSGWKGYDCCGSAF